MGEYLTYYETNQDFRDYVDAFCRVHKTSIAQALQYQIVREYLDYLLQKI